MRHQEEFKEKLLEEYMFYDHQKNSPEFENSVLSIVAEAAFGEAADLYKDLGIEKKNLSFTRVGDYAKMREDNMVNPSDANLQYLMNQLFLPIDMTDYETQFVSEAELSEDIEVRDLRRMYEDHEDFWPRTGRPVGEFMPEPKVFARTSTMFELQTMEPEEEEEYEEEEDDEEEEDEDDDEEEEDEELPE